MVEMFSRVVTKEVCVERNSERERERERENVCAKSDNDKYHTL